MLFDQEHLERQQAIDQAFAEGEKRGRKRCDSDLVNLMIELRVENAQNVAKAYREGIEVGLFLAILGVAVILCFGLFAWWLL